MSITMARTAALATALALVYSASALAADTEETPAGTAGPALQSARDLVDAQRYDAALPLLRQIDQRNPDNPDVLNLIGFSLRKTGKMDEALAFYNRALALSPQHLGANEYLGELYLETRRPEKARERLEVLREACGNCEEFQELQVQIERYAAQ